MRVISPHRGLNRLMSGRSSEESKNLDAQLVDLAGRMLLLKRLLLERRRAASNPLIQRTINQ
jgi:hypothetical protein